MQRTLSMSKGNWSRFWHLFWHFCGTFGRLFWALTLVGRCQRHVVFCFIASSASAQLKRLTNEKMNSCADATPENEQGFDASQ